MIELPEDFRSVKYNGDCFPGSPHAVEFDNGANCQHFAFELLRRFGHPIPNLRSSELWFDRKFTQRIWSFEPLDLLLLNSGEDPWGAHVGVLLAEDQIAHLSKEVGVPAVWTFAEFRKRPRYRVLLGGKRFKGLERQ